MPSPPRREAREREQRELLAAFGQAGAAEVLNERAVAVMKRMSDKLTGRDFAQEVRSLVFMGTASTQRALGLERALRYFYLDVFLWVAMGMQVRQGQGSSVVLILVSSKVKATFSPAWLKAHRGSVKLASMCSRAQAIWRVDQEATYVNNCLVGGYTSKTRIALLQGSAAVGGETDTVREQVARLLLQATSHENLCQSYIGWCPFW